MGGTFASSPGSGEVPGDEAWVVTPFGVVRYAVAALTLTVGALGGDLRVDRGAAYVFGSSASGSASASTVSRGGWSRVGDGATFHLGPSSGWPLACEAARNEVDRVRAVLLARAAAPHAAPAEEAADAATFGSLSAESVRDAESMRATCAVATFIASAR